MESQHTSGTGYALAMETSGRVGSLALGLDGRVLEEVVMVEPPGQPRKGADLVPAIDGLCRRHGARPGDLREVYVSLGPGSFSGLRTSITAAKMLALAVGAKLVGVPTIQVLPLNLSEGEGAEGLIGEAPEYAGVCLNLKRDTVYCGVFRRPAPGQGPGWTTLVEPGLRTAKAWLELAPRPVWLVGDPLPELPAALPEGVAILPARLAVARARHLYALGWHEARAGRYADPMALAPVYGRIPEAVELWDRRLAGQ